MHEQELLEQHTRKQKRSCELHQDTKKEIMVLLSYMKEARKEIILIRKDIMLSGDANTNYQDNFLDGILHHIEELEDML